MSEMYNIPEDHKELQGNKDRLLHWLQTNAEHEWCAQQDTPARRKPLLSKKNTIACLKFAKYHKDKPEDYWKYWFVNGWVQSKTVWLRKITFGKNQHATFNNSNHIPTVKHGDGGIIILFV